MRAWTIIVLLVLVGIVGAWAGYWIGHFAGWSKDAEWPLRIGGGDGAILLSIGLSFLSVMAGLGWLLVRPALQNRRLLVTGTRARATIVKVWRTGVSTGGLAGSRRQLGVELQVHPADRASYTTRTTCLADPAAEGRLAPGADVNVCYDPSRPRSVAIEGPVAAATG